jgi:hypothetical protein
MAKRTGGFIGQDGINAPDQATGVSGAAGEAQVTVSFTAPTDVGGSAITGYRVQSNDGIGASGSASPITVSGLTNGTSYTFNVWAINPFGWSSPSDASGSVSPAAVRGVFGGGNGTSGAGTNVIQYVEIGSTGNAVDFGDLTNAKDEQNYGSIGSNTRGIFAGSINLPPAHNTQAIDYITISSTGNASDYGDTGVATVYSWSSFSSSTRGLLTTNGSGYASTTDMRYLTIATTGSTSSFGTSSINRRSGVGFASPTRGCTAGGNSTASFMNSIEYVTIASLGNGTDFGDLTVSRELAGACSTNTRGIVAGGAPSSNGQTDVIDYVTIASTGNASDFGDLTVSRRTPTGTSNSTRGVFAGGFSGSGPTRLNTIDYITISSAGNASDFGDLLAINGSMSATSNGHGGLS